MYEGEDYDLAGFCVGVVEKAEIIDGSKVAAGDALLALPSSGPHSNGYSLIRKIIEVSGADIENIQLDGKPLTDLLMAPTRIYVKPLLKLIKDTGASRPWPTSPAAACWTTSRAFCQKAPRPWLTWPAGLARRSSTGCKRKATSTRPRCTALNCGVGMVICVAQAYVKCPERPA
jgi:phosphoribosylformylglycinamidine cyclo-ligase